MSNEIANESDKSCTAEQKGKTQTLGRDLPKFFQAGGFVMIFGAKRPPNAPQVPAQQRPSNPFRQPTMPVHPLRLKSGNLSFSESAPVHSCFRHHRDGCCADPVQHCRNAGEFRLFRR